MSGLICRLSVQTDAARSFDLVLPATAPVAELLPTIVTLTGAPPELGGWYLSRLNGGRVDESISLCQNMIEDGELLVLTPAPVPPMSTRPRDAVELTAAAAVSPASSSAIPQMVFLWAVVLTAVFAGRHGGALFGSLAAAAGCVAAAVSAGRSDHPIGAVLGCAAIIFGSAAGFLAVPSGPSAPNALLAAVAAISASVVLLRSCPEALPVAAGTVGCCVPIALTAALATARHLPTGALGATVSTLALTVLSAAPRLALSAAGSTPGLPPPQRAVQAHRVLTGLVLGSAAAAAIGAGYVAVDHRRAALVFGWLLTTATLLRVLTFVDAERRWAVAVSGLCCATAAFAATAVQHPAWVPWLSLTVLATGVVALRCAAPRAAALRVLAHAEVVTLALLVPSALWVVDIYAMARGG
ncbi:type VII secretion integral membrane protein EccD [Mycobacterium sp. MAA66]